MTENPKAKTAHFGDPCIFCKVGHEDLQTGPCPENDCKLRVAGYVLIDNRWDGVQHYRYRTTDGRVREIHSHASNHAPYYHFGLSDDLIQTPPWDETLKSARVTA